MPLFRYEALSSSGKTLTSVIDADSLASAKERLRRQRVFVIRLEASESHQKYHLSSPMLLSFTKELAKLLRAGLPLYESLVTIEEKYRKTKMHPLFLSLCDQIKEGSSFSLILKRYPTLFHPIYLAMVQVGERSGDLPFSMECLYTILEKQQKLKKQLLGALIYPGLLSAFCFCILCGLFFFMVPAMQELFEGRRLHPFTAGVLSLSQFLRAHLTAFLGGGIGTAFLILLLWFKKQTRDYLSSLYLKIPYLNRLIRDANWARFFRVSSLLLRGGLTLAETLQLSSHVLTHPLFKAVIDRSGMGIMEGKPLSILLQKEPLMDRIVFRICALGEETGKMGDAFESLATLYEEELNQHLNQLTTFLQPALLIILGGVVGLVILSILLPLTDVSSFLSH